MLVKTSSALL